MATQDDNVPGSVNPYLDSLIWGAKWDTAGGTAPVTYYFNNSGGAFSAAEIEAFEKVLANFSAVADIQFERTLVEAGANFVWTLTPPANPEQQVPDPEFTTGGTAQGTFPLIGLPGRASVVIQGTAGYQTVLHELGHGMGLAHPHDGGADGDSAGSLFPGVDNSADTGDYALNQSIWTVMSYNMGWTGAPPVIANSQTLVGNNYGFAGTLMAFDIAALQAIYGANNTYKTGDDVYLLPSSNTNGVAFWSSIWDAGGVDTISNAGNATGAIINLNDASLDVITDGANAAGYVSYVNGIRGGFTIANGVEIENAIGGSGADTITGNEFDNVIEGGAGNDTLDGGEGAEAEGDTLSYASATLGVTVNLSLPTAQATGGAGTDTIKNFENLWGSKSNDTLTGDKESNYIYGGDGNDTIQGGAGADTLVGGLGIDTVSYENSESPSGVWVFLSDQGTSFADGKDKTPNMAGQGLGGDAAGDLLFGFENIIGSAFTDNLIGDSNVNNIKGGGGDDFIRGMRGNDTLDGGTGVDGLKYDELTNAQHLSVTLGTWTASTGASLQTSVVIKDDSGATIETDLVSNFESVTAGSGNDTLNGNAAANTLEGGAGNDIINGGLGNDTLNGGLDTDTLSYAGMTISLLTVNLLANTASYKAGAVPETDTISNFENIVGSAAADTLTGDNGDNVIEGGLGDDILNGGAEGAAGDTVSYASSTLAVTVNLETIGAQNTGGAGKDTLSGFENILGGKGNDVLTGSTGSNYIYGGDGDDIIEGGGGADMLVGGLGVDTLSYANATKSVSAYLDQQGVSKSNGEKDTDGTPQFGGDAHGDLIWGFENLIGGKEADFLVGNSGKNDIKGGAGNDTIAGGLGNDTLDGGEGIDYLSHGQRGASEHVYLTLGAWDAKALTTAQSTVSIKNDSGVVTETDTIKNFEWADGGQGNDVLTGNAGVNYLSGQGGNDILDGGAGADLLDGSNGTDIVSYANSSAAVTIDLSLNDNMNPSNSGKQIGGDAAGDQLSSIEGVIGSKFNDIITGSTADDTFVGGAGKDAFNGGGGNNTVSYAGETTGVTVNLLTNVATGGNALGDTFTDIQNLIGTGAADKLTGDSNDNYIYGGAGDDVIEAGDGADSYVGGLGVDTLSFANLVGFQSVYVDLASQGSSKANGEKDGNPLQMMGNGNNDGIWGFENLIGGIGHDSLHGDAGKNNIKGGDGNDTIGGGAGNDILDGGAGDRDFLFYQLADSNSHLSVTLGAGGAVTTATLKDSSGKIIDSDTVSNFEGVYGGDGNDTLIGNALANELNGGAGNDLLIGGAGADLLIGVTGYDTASYATSTAGVTINLALNDNLVPSASGKQKGGDAEGDQLSNIDAVIGSAFNDLLAGSGLNETFTGGAGADSFYGGGGNDTVTYATETTGVTVNLTTKTGTGGNAAGDYYSDVRSVIGTSGADLLIGDGNDNELIYGGAGNDVIEGRGGADNLVGGLGIDTLSYAGSNAAVTVRLTQQGTSLANGEKGADGLFQQGGHAQGNLIWGFENLTGSAYDDTLRGDSSGNVLDGGAGIDTAEYTYLASGKNLTVTLGLYDAKLGTTAQSSTSGITGDIDTLKNFENVTGGDGNDKLTGNNGDNTLFGTYGNDILSGMAGNDLLMGGFDDDTLNGGDGDDFLMGGYGNDTFIGGLGADTIIGLENSSQEGEVGDKLDYSASNAGVTIQLTKGNFGTGKGGHAEGDKIAGILHVVGSNHNDVLRGDASKTVLQLTLDGGAGDDFIQGAPTDVYMNFLDGGTNGAAGDTVDFSWVSNANALEITLSNTKDAVVDVINAPNAGTQIKNFENIIGGKGSDKLTGNDAKTCSKEERVTTS